MSVIDPAVGSGHFLIAAAHRMARRLAQVRTGDEEPSPQATRRALRDVIGRCLYGVDINPMAAELAKVGLWIESLEPGKPLGFLDAHIQVGNSLLGATPELIAAGIPDGAYVAIEGDDKPRCTALKRQNRAEREGLGGMFADDEARARRTFADAVVRLQDGSDDLAGQRRREGEYAGFRSSPEFVRHKMLADAWCAAFLLPKARGARDAWLPAVTTATLEAIVSGGTADDVEAAVAECAARLRPLHFHLAFPEVHARGGFDVVLGNPPWERVKLQEKEFFAERSPEIAAARDKAQRDSMITAKRGTALHAEFLQAKRDAEASSAFMRKSDRFPLAGRGDVNTYAVFAELERTLLNDDGRAGIIVPSGIATDDTTKAFFSDLVDRGSLVSLYDFENGMRAAEAPGDDDDPETPEPAKKPTRAQTGGDRLLFASVDSRFKFCLLTARASAHPISLSPDLPDSLPPSIPTSPPLFAFFLHRPSELLEPGRAFSLTAADIALLNPNTRTCPVFRSQRDAEITKAIYRRIPVLIREGDPDGNPWGIEFSAMFHMSNDSHLFRTREELEAAGGTLEGNRWHVAQDATVAGKRIDAGRWLPLYEAKMVHHFDHRWATYETVATARGKKQAGDVDTRDVTSNEKRDPTFVVQPRYWVAEAEVDAKAASDAGWFIGFRDICRSTDERTAIFGVVPRTAVGNNLPLLHPSKPGALAAGLAACTSSIVFDFAARVGVGGTHMNFYILEQLPALAPTAYHGACDWSAAEQVSQFISRRTIELSYTAHDVTPFARDLGYNGPPFRWDDERRFWLRAELDAAFFHLYGIARDDVNYIMGTFPIVRRKDLATHGTYRTRDAILQVYDAMAEAIRTGAPYQTVLDPPPANGWTPPPLPTLEAAVPPPTAPAPAPAPRAAAPRPAPAAGPAAPTPAPRVPSPAPRPAAPPPAEPLEMAPSRPKPMLDAEGNPVRVRVYTADGEIALNRGLALAHVRQGEATVWTVLADGETVARRFVSPPAVVRRLTKRRE